MKNLLLKRGTVVVAERHLDEAGANVRPGTMGVVYEEAEFFAVGEGPTVRWMNMGTCQVYPGDVRVTHPVDYVLG